MNFINEKLSTQGACPVHGTRLQSNGFKIMGKRCGFGESGLVMREFSNLSLFGAGRWSLS